jgi:hypothetical protein
MKAYLEFNLDEPEDASDHRRCVNSIQAYLAISEVFEFFRNMRKYDTAPSSELVALMKNEKVRNAISLIEDGVIKIINERVREEDFL